MNKLNYTITLLTDWHIGSGLSGGAETDADVLKDKNGMPYIPGKTIKGLLKYAIQEMEKDANKKFDWTEKVFGVSDGQKDTDGESIGKSGASFFSNATIVEVEYNEVVQQQLQTYLYRQLASTRIDQNGVAKDKSLRVFETCMPITLEGYITNIENIDQMEMAMKWTRNVGINRNRGLGKCIWKIKKDNNGK